ARSDQGALPQGRGAPPRGRSARDARAGRAPSPPVCALAGCHGATGSGGGVTKRVDRPHKPRGNPLKLPPGNAARRIAALAAAGHSVVGIARGLSTSKDTLRRWMEEDPALADALAQGREAERFALHNLLYRKAMRGNVICAMFLLKARHGYREGDQSDAANRVSITFTLPAALPPERYVAAIDHEAAARTLA